MKVYIVLAGAALIAASASAAPAQSYVGSVRGVAEADSVAGAAADSAAGVDAPAATSTAIQVASGEVRFSGLVQAWYSAFDGGDINTFRLRRAEMKFAGQVTERAGWVVTVDPAKALKVNHSYSTVGDQRVVSEQEVNQASLLLQDAYVEVGVGAIDVTAGQFKLPISREGSEISSARLATVERARFISAGKYGLVRDVGVMMTGSPVASLTVQLGLFNGAGEHQNSVDSDDGKVLAGRLRFDGGIEGLSVGASGAWSGEGAESERRTDRLGADLQLARGPLLVRGEVMRGWDGLFSASGYYGLATYHLGGSLDLTGRYDVWDRDIAREESAADARERNYELSLSHAVGGPNTRVQLGLLRRDWGGLRVASNQVLVNFQTSW